MKKVLVILALLLAFASAIPAQDADDPQLDQRVQTFSQELRCLVCQNETLADSQAMLAVDLKRQIREQMKAGKTDKEILAYLTDRYGDFVLYRPPVKKQTYLLWFGPFILLAAGLYLLFRYIRSRRSQIHEEPLSAAEHARALELLQKQSGEETI
jgi:cytochrome c-type biogenesis protein CcmH